MPLNRYQIRNEYSLADPELYKTADKDDPEALLEGVAMAGLVGVLRQLGDLAEFAAEIFHDLHEEVMATAARGHSLTVRVQQLEAEMPFIERAFLSQTNHSSFFYNAGTDWHPNMRMDQNMVTQGDLPRFVMDSYEECRGPPRLFLLDKFDVAGAGACLKRYTDPSFFKVETSSFAFTTSDVQREREKKTRKTKKRGSRWRNGETPEVLTTSHAKLHQLFLKERIENGINVPAHRVKLKRKMNGFPFDPKSGKSYMNKYLEATSPEHKVVHEISIDSSPLRLTSTDAYGTMMDTEEIRPPSPDKEVMQRKKIAFSSPSPPQSEDCNDVKPCLDGVNEDPSYDGVREICIPRPSHNTQSTNILPSTHSVVDEKEIAVDGENRIEGSVGYESDDVASEVDNYVDALATMDSELDTDSEQRAKRNLHFLNSKRQVFCSSSSSEKLQAQSSDSAHSIENSSLSDDGNSYSKKEISSFSCSDSPSASVESVLSEREISGKEAKTSDTSYNEKSVNPETQLPQPLEHGDYDNKCIMVAREPCVSGDPGEPTTSLIVTDSTPMPIHAEAGICLEGSGMRAETNEKFVTDDKSENSLTSIVEETTNLHGSPSDTPDLPGDAEQDLDDSPSRASIEDNLAADDFVDGSSSPGEKVLYASYSSNELPWSKSPKIQHESKSDVGHMNMVNNLPFASDLQNVPSQDRRELLSSDNQHLHNLDGEDPSLGEDSTSLYNLSGGALSIEDDISPSLLDVNLPNHQDGLNNENSNGIHDASVQVEETCMKKPHNLITTEVEAGNAEEEHEETHGTFSDVATFEEEGYSASRELLSARPSTGMIASSHVESLTNEVTLSDETENKIDRSDVTDETASLAASADKGDKDDVRSSFGDSSLNELELDHMRLPDCLAESKFEKPVADSLDSDSSVHDTSNYHHLESEVLGTLYENKLPVGAENTLDLSAASSQPLDTEQVSFQRRDVADSTEDASFLQTVSREEKKNEFEDNQSFGAENTLDSNAALTQSLGTEQASSQRRDVADSTEGASTVCSEERNNELEDNQLNEEFMDKADVNVDQSPLMEQMQPSSDVDEAPDASSQSLLGNLPSYDAVPDVLADSSDHDPQPSLTDYCAEERADSTIYEHDKMEALDGGDARSEPLALLSQPQQVDSFDLKQSAEASSICLPTPSPSQPSFPELVSQYNQVNLSSLSTHHPDKEEDDLECKELDKEKLIDEGVAVVEKPQFEEAHLSNHVDIVGALNASIPFMANVPSQPSVSNPLPLNSHNVNPFEHGNTTISTSPTFVVLPGEPQIDLAEMPPLPPLPPIQWRMGKLHSSPDLDEEPTPHHIGANLSSLAPRTDQNAQPVNHNMALSAVATESAELTDCVTQSGPSTLPTTILRGNGRVRFIDPVDKHSMTPHFPLPGQYHEMQQLSLHGIREDEAEPVNSIPDVIPLDKPSIDALDSSEDLIQPQNQVAPELLSKEQSSAHLEGNLPITDGIKPKAAPLSTGLTDASGSFSHEPSQPQFQSQSEHNPLHQLAPETSSNRSNLEETPTSLERNVVTHGTIIVPSYTENAKPDHSIPTTEADIIWPAVEEGNTNGIRTVKLQRPRTPLIDDLATHDKSKLRKVTERVRPEVQKDDDRDSLLEQKLRKVTERVRPEVQTVDDRDSLLEQKLRKVTERVRPEVQTVDDRDSLLEQIRKKSFNLKPTVATRPGIQGPQTNLRVAAILEKAKTIRQAFAGSDEDDEDSWSDS